MIFRRNLAVRRAFLSLIIASCISIALSGQLLAQPAKQPAARDWEKTIEAAREEGKVVVSIPASAELRKQLEKNFEKRFNIDTSWLRENGVIPAKDELTVKEFFTLEISPKKNCRRFATRRLKVARALLR